MDDQEGYDFSYHLHRQFSDRNMDIRNFRKVLTHGNGSIDDIIASMDINCLKVMVVYAPTDLTLEFIVQASRREFAGAGFNYMIA